MNDERLTLFGPALRRAREQPNGVAFQLLGRHAATVSNLGLIEGASRYRSLLERRRIGRGHIVVLMLEHGADQYFGFIGALLVGAIPTFMPPLTSKQNPELYWSAHATLFARLKPAGLIVSAAHCEDLGAHIVTAGIEVMTPEDAADEPVSVSPAPSVDVDDLALLQHSSGTTQLKNGVELTHRAVLAQIRTYAAALQITSSDRIATWLPLYHDMGLMACFMMPLVLGVPVVALDPFEWVMAPDSLLRAIEDHRCTLTWLPNFAFHHLARTRQAETYDLTSVRAWIDCSEPCRPYTFDLFADTFADCGVTRERLQVCYAMAETVFAVSQTRPGRVVSRLHVDEAALRERNQVMASALHGPGLDVLSAGHVLPGLQVQILAGDGQPLPCGRVGEITVSGAFVASGYCRLPKRTAEKFKDDVYRTGDRGFFWCNELYVLGRQDEVMIINGRNFHCHEVEQIVSAIPQIKPGRVVVFSVEDRVAGTDAAIMIAECQEPGDIGATTLKRRIRQALLSHCGLILRDVVLAPPGLIIKTTSGKISRVENRVQYLADNAEKLSERPPHRP
jgi:fatty-acyl-CoA synthase